MAPSDNDRWHAVQLSALAISKRHSMCFARASRPSRHFAAGATSKAEDVSINEVDALVISSDRLCLIEIKPWNGEIGGNQHTWTIRNGARERVEETPAPAR